MQIEIQNLTSTLYSWITSMTASWTMYSPILLVAIYSTIAIRRYLQKRQFQVELILRLDGSIPIIWQIMQCEDIYSANQNPTLSSSELRSEITNIGQRLRKRERTRYIATVCGEKVAFFVTGERIMFSVNHERTRKSLELALQLVMNNNLCHYLDYYPWFDFQD